MAKKKISIKTRLILYDKGKILLLKQTKPNGGKFTFVGGTIGKQEFAKDALVREAYEEAGILLKKEDLQLVHVLHKHMLDEQRIILYFKSANWGGEVRSREPFKFKEAQWFSLDNLPKNITGSIRQVLKMYRNGKLYSEQRKTKKASI